jgi:tRNA threonylcarbamoyladenosine dehydratase
MSSWIFRATASHNVQLVITAVISGVVVAGAILGFQKSRRQYMVEDLKASIPSINQEHVATRVIICSFFHGS